MSTYKKHPVTQIITDTGPLISLACADRLDLLQAFNRPVLIPDVIMEECLRKQDAPGGSRLQAYFSENGSNQFEIIPTPMGPIMKDMVGRERAGEIVDGFAGFGDATISWVVANLDRIKAPGSIALVLTEDSSFGDVALANSSSTVHVLGFRAWLGYLEANEIISSKNDISRLMMENGRRLNKYSADRPGKVDKGTRTDWTSSHDPS